MKVKQVLNDMKVNDDRFFILGWTVPLNMHLLPENECITPSSVWLSEDTIFADPCLLPDLPD